MGMVYDDNFYAQQGAGSAQSAARLVPLIGSLIKLASVFDLGCGRGHWLKVFKQEGVAKVHGVDGPWVDPATIVLERSEFTQHDFAAAEAPPALRSERYDLATSFEVLEHMTNEAADRAIGLLSELSDALVVGVALPGQGGADHINEQWPAHWYEKLRRHGYECFDCLRPQIWNDGSVEWWYAQNSLVYARGDKAEAVRDYTARVQGRVGEPLPLVHPRLFLQRHNQALRTLTPLPRRVARKLKNLIAR